MDYYVKRRNSNSSNYNNSENIYKENIIRANAGNGISEDSKAIYPRGETRMPTITCFIQFLFGRSY